MPKNRFIPLLFCLLSLVLLSCTAEEYSSKVSGTLPDFKKTAPTIVLSTESGAELYPIQGSSCLYPKSGKGYVSCSDVPSVDNALLTYQSFDPDSTLTAHFNVDHFGDEISDISINAYDLDHNTLEKNISYTQMDTNTYEIGSDFNYGSDARFILSFFVRFTNGSDVSYYFPLSLYRL